MATVMVLIRRMELTTVVMTLMVETVQRQNAQVVELLIQVDLKLVKTASMIGQLMELSVVMLHGQILELTVLH